MSSNSLTVVIEEKATKICKKWCKMDKINKYNF